MNTNKDRSDIIAVEKEKLDAWFKLKSNDAIIEKLTKLLDKALEKVDLKNCSYLSIGTQVNNYIREIGYYPEFVTIDIIRNDKKEIAEIKCSARSVMFSKKPELITFSKKY